MPTLEPTIKVSGKHILPRLYSQRDFSKQYQAIGFDLIDYIPQIDHYTITNRN